MNNKINDMERLEEINAQILEWAREEAAFRKEEVANKLRIPLDTIIDWEKGNIKPSISNLRSLSIIYDTPFSYFFLSRIPRVIPVKDFRGKPKVTKKELSSSTKLALREFRRLHRFTRILHSLFNKSKKLSLDYISGSEDIEELASRERIKLGITEKDKKQWPNKQYSWQKWREAIEGIGISVFSLHMSPLECRGAAISEEPYSILVNRSDAPAAKSFTLLHEYYHLLLRSGDSLCLCDNYPSNTESKPNQFASLVMVSNEEFLDGLTQENVKKYREFWSNSILDNLSRKYLVSRDVVAIRLEQLGYAPEGFYAKRREYWDNMYKEYEGYGLGGKTKMGHAKEKIGDYTLNLVYQAIKRGAISTIDAASFLGEVRGSRSGPPWKMTVQDIEKWIQKV